MKTPKRIILKKKKKQFIFPLKTDQRSGARRAARVFYHASEIELGLY